MRHCTLIAIHIYDRRDGFASHHFMTVYNIFFLLICLLYYVDACL